MVKRYIQVFIGLLLLTLPFLFLRYYPQHLNSWLVTNITWFPYLVLVIAGIISMVFYNSREFCISLVLLVYYFLLDQYLWPTGLSNEDKVGLLNLCGVLIPINFILFNILPERGLFNRQGLKLLSLLTGQLILILILFKADLTPLRQLFYSHVGIKWSSHPEFGSVMLLLNASALLFLLVRTWTQSGVLANAWLFCFGAVLISMMLVLNLLFTIVYLVLSGVILIGGILLHAYNLAYRDELTQLPSRRSLKQYLMAQGKNLAIAMVDVDHFKKLNDTYGHDTGDDVLKMLAGNLQAVSGGGRAFRYGGEEFTVVFPGKTAEQAMEYLEELRQRIETSKFIIRPKRRNNSQKAKKSAGNSRELTITVSIGVSDQGKDSRSTPEIMKLADKALYQAKQQGRNQVKCI